MILVSFQNKKCIWCKELTEEYTKVLEQKKEWYREYREVRSEMKKFQLAQEITRTFLNEEQQMPKRGLIERWVSGDWGIPQQVERSGSLSLDECINKDTACQFANLYFTPRQKILSCRNRISMSRNTKRTPTNGSSWGFFVYRRAFPADVSSESARIVLWENGG